MDEQNRYEGFSPSVYGTQVAALPDVFAPPSGAIAPPLRPLSTGEILDRTFALYKRRFWLFLAIGMLPALMVALSSAARMLYLSLTHRIDMVRPGASPEALASVMDTTLRMQVYLLPASVLFLVAYGLSHAATVYAVSRISQGLEVTAGEAYQVTRVHWLRWTGIALRQFWSVVWPVLPVAAVLGFGVFAARGNTVLVGLLSLGFALLLPAALVFGVINLLRNALSMPAGAQENLGVNAAMRRSKALAAGRKGRIFLSLLLVYALQMVAGALQLPFVWLAVTTRGAEHIVLQAAQLLISFVATALVAPVASIALTLLYVDERVRREGYDIEVMMQHTFRPAPSSTPAGTYQA
ncbi:MAG: hypothetical protein ACRYF4_02290 [Janthinobacterium lividum]